MAAPKCRPVRRIQLPIVLCRLLVKPPLFGGRSRLSTAQARGKTYERKVAKELTREMVAGLWPPGTLLHPGPWIEYCDAEGSGLCQPDLVATTEDALFLFEVKLKQVARAWDQLEYLYLPLCRGLWPRSRTFLIQVFKFPACDKTSRWIDNPTKLLAPSAPSGLYCWHHLP